MSESHLLTPMMLSLLRYVYGTKWTKSLDLRRCGFLCIGSYILCLSISKVASRSVFITTSLMYMALAILSKLSAVFISMPYPVLGGTMITILGVFVGVNLSNLRVVDLASSRNVSIIGMAVFTGRLIPSWVEQNSDAIDTGKRCYTRVPTEIQKHNSMIFP